MELLPPRRGSWCEACFNLSETFAIESGQAVDEDDFDNLPHLSWCGVGQKWYIINGTFQLFKKSASSGCRFCKFLEGVMNAFVPNQSIHTDAMVIHLDEACLDVEILPSNGDAKNFVSNTLTPNLSLLLDSVAEQSTTRDYEDYEHIPILPDISLPNSENSFRYLESCLETCIKTHRKCKQELSSPPRRLLRLGSPGDSLVHLYETPDDFQDPYVALSYCWGKSATLKTTRSNMEFLTTKGFDLEQLPAALRDAIRITRRLGLGYVWIDALCIVQDDRRDWEEQSARMCSIYEQAYLTVAASTAAAADISFLGHASRPPTFRYRVPDESGGVGGSGHHYNPVGRVRTPPEPILTRGWTLQESLLATRCVAYSANELQWRCRTGASCECGMPAELRRDIIVRSMEEDEEGDDEGEDDEDDDDDEEEYEEEEPDSALWNKVVEQYTQRQLSVPTDKLPALSGICQFISKRQRSTPSTRYLAGLWENELPYCLLWYRAAEIEGSETPAPATWRAPTFSWASLDCPVYPFIDFQNVYESAQPVSFAIEPAGEDPFGQVKPGASMMVKGKLVRDVMIYRDLGMFRREESKHDRDEFARYRVRRNSGEGRIRSEDIVADGWLEAFGFQDAHGRLQRSVRRAARDTGQEAAEMGREHYKPNSNSTFYFLVLGVSPSNHAAYERLGMVSWSFGHHEFDDEPEEIIMLL
ncbi:HET-domain-containing protein [Hypoxylon sp. FL1150]|nr:HET-domain-containing protein [Hypoxylon sp. FL1150]